MTLTLGQKLGFGFGCILALLVLNTVLAYWKADEVSKSEDFTFYVRVPALIACKQLQRDLNQTASKARQVILAGSDQKRRDAARKLFDDAWNEIEEQQVATLDELAPKFTLSADREKYADVKKLLAALREVEEASFKRAAGNEHDAVILAGNDLSDNGIAVNDAMKASLGDLADSFDALLQRETKHLQDQNRSMKLSLGTIALVALAVGIFVAVFLSRAISGASQSIMVQAEAIAVTASDVAARTVSICAAISEVALAVCAASVFTSPATTAKPLPASPARAASMVAFKARRLVCCAIEVMTLMTSPISIEE